MVLPAAIRRLGFGGVPKRTVLIPNQWDGSVQHYYHFMLGYLFPIFRWMDKHEQTPLSVRDCGPMNAWFELVRETHDVDILTVGDVLHILAGDLAPLEVLPGLDDPQTFSSRQLRRFALRTSEIAASKGVRAQEADVLVSARTTKDSFYTSELSEAPGSGPERRSVPNLDDIVASWNDDRITSVDMSTLNIYEQIRMHNHARVLIGQHGAGLTSMLWMSPGSAVIEILPPVPTHTQRIFADLARAMGLHYTVISQAGLHDPVDADQLTRALESVW